MKIIIVGFGTSGKHYFELLKKLKLKHKISILEKNFNKDNQTKHLNIYKNLNDIRKSKQKFDYAIIATPSHLHFKFADFFIRQKTNVLIEKPMVLKLNHAKTLIKITEKFRVKCWVALQNRYNKAIQKFKTEIFKKKLGTISLIDSTLIWKRDFKYYKKNWRGKYRTDGGVLSNQAIHLLDTLIYLFGEIKKLNVIAGFNKKKLQAEDLISINFLHKNNIISSLKATTRADRDYRVAIDAIGNKGRIVVKGISLNTFNIFKKGILKYDRSNSEEFSLGKGPLSGMGNGHYKLLKEFLGKKRKCSKNLEIKNNYYLLKVLHSIYNSLNDNKFSVINDKQSILGK